MVNCSNIVAPNAEQIGVGSFYIVLSSLLLLVYIPTLTVLWRDEDLMVRPIYKLLVWDSVCDLIQVMGVGLAAGVYSLLNNVCNWPVNLIIGYLTNAAWFAGCFLDMSVSLNRFLSLTSTTWTDQLFAGRRSYLWVAGAFSFGISVNSIYVGRGGGMNYNLDLYAWYLSDADGSIGVNEQIQFGADYTVQPIMLIFCLATAYQLVRKRNLSSQQQLRKKEKYAIYQVFVICFLLIAMGTIWLIGPNISSSRWVIFTCNTLWMSVAGSYPFIILRFNTTVRNKIIDAFKGLPIGATNKVTTNTSQPAFAVRQNTTNA